MGHTQLWSTRNEDTNWMRQIAVIGITGILLLGASTAAADTDGFLDCAAMDSDLCVCLNADEEECEIDESPDGDISCQCFFVCDPAEGHPGCQCFEGNGAACDTPNQEGCYCEIVECDPNVDECSCTDGGGDSCDPTDDVGACIGSSVDSCDAEADCPTGTTCLDGFCQPVCRSDADCDSQRCNLPVEGCRCHWGVDAERPTGEQEVNNGSPGDSINNRPRPVGSGEDGHSDTDAVGCTMTTHGGRSASALVILGALGLIVLRRQ